MLTFASGMAIGVLLSSIARYLFRNDTPSKDTPVPERTKSDPESRIGSLVEDASHGLHEDDYGKAKKLLSEGNNIEKLNRALLDWQNGANPIPERVFEWLLADMNLSPERKPKSLPEYSRAVDSELREKHGQEARLSYSQNLVPSLNRIFKLTKASPDSPIDFSEMSKAILEDLSYRFKLEPVELDDEPFSEEMHQCYNMLGDTPIQDGDIVFSVSPCWMLEERVIEKGLIRKRYENAD